MIAKIGGARDPPPLLTEPATLIEIVHGGGAVCGGSFENGRLKRDRPIGGSAGARRRRGGPRQVLARWRSANRMLSMRVFTAAI